MNQVDLMTPEKVAAQYGGDKRKIAQAASMGVIDPTVAVMAGMFIDRMRNAAASEQAPNTTVAQDVMAPPAPQPQMQVGIPAAASAASAPVERGLEAIPVPEEMYDEQSFAGGGIVAFQQGGYSDLGQYVGAGMSGESVDAQLKRLDWLEQRGAISPQEAANKRMELQTQGGFEPRFRGFPGMQSTMGGVRPGLYPLITPEQPKATPKVTLDQTPKAGEKAPAEKAPAEKAKADKAAADRIAAARASASTALSTKAKGTQPTSSEEDYYAKVQALNERAGVAKDPDAAARAALDEMRAASKASKEDALNMALINAGLGIAAGTSPYALQNVATGAQEGMKSYAQSQKEAKDEAREYLKIQAELDRAADARARGDVKTALELEQSAQKRALELEKLNIDRAQLGIARAQLNRTPAEIQLVERVAAEQKVPFFEAYRMVYGAKQEPKSRDAAMKEWSANYILQKKYPTFDSYYNSISGNTDPYTGFSGQEKGK